MSIFRIYLQAWKDTFRHWKLWALLYGFNLLFALVVIVPFRSFFSDTIGNSLALDELVQGFDLDIITDYLNSYGQGFNFFTTQSLILLLLYLLFSAFTMGGILHSFKVKQFHFGEFWANSSRFFWRMLRLAIYFGLIQLLLAIIAFMLFQFFANDFSTDVLQSEVQIIKALYGVGIPYLLLAFVVFMLHDYVKVYLVHHSQAWLMHPFWESIQFAFQHFLKTYPLYLLNILVAVLVFALYKSISMTLSGAITAMFLLGQFFILFRIATRLVALDSANIFYDDHSFRS